MGAGVGIVVVRHNGTVIEMPQGPDRFHAEFKRAGVAQAVDRRTGRTFAVQATQEGWHVQENQPVQSDQAPVLIRTPKLPMNK